jgi:hypothetical protein
LTKQRIERVACSCLILVTAFVSFIVHPVLGSWSYSQLSIKKAIYAATQEKAGLISGGDRKIDKFVDRFTGNRIIVYLNPIRPEEVSKLLKLHRSVQIVLIN